MSSKANAIQDLKFSTGKSSLSEHGNKNADCKKGANNKASGNCLIVVTTRATNLFWRCRTVCFYECILPGWRVHSENCGSHTRTLFEVLVEEEGDKRKEKERKEISNNRSETIIVILDKSIYSNSLGLFPLSVSIVIHWDFFFIQVHF